MSDNDLNAGDLPRYAIKLQDNQTGFTMAVGTNDWKAFKRSDLAEFVRTFKRRADEAERRQTEAAAKGAEE